MAPLLSQSEIQEITRLLELGKALPEKYRDILFLDQQLPPEYSTAAASPEPKTPTERPVQAQSSKPYSTTTFSLTDFGKFLMDSPRIQHVVSDCLSTVKSGTHDRYLNDHPELLAPICAEKILQIVPQVLEESRNDEYLLAWREVATLPKDTQRQLVRVVREKLLQRGIEIKKERKARETEGLDGLLAKHADIVSTFLAIAERKVSVLDEYGDERMHLLPSLVDDCVAKIAGREGEREVYIRAELKKGGFRLHKRHKELLQLRETLPAMFAKYHAEQRGKNRTLEELASLSGVDFETAVGRVLMEHGWHVTATSATGDQGADIIATKGERKVIIQAKRYSGAVGNKAVQEVVGAIPFYGGTEGCVVTNSTFTPGARALAQKNNIRLIDGLRFGEIGEL